MATLVLEMSAACAAVVFCLFVHALIIEGALHHSEGANRVRFDGTV